VQLTTTDGSYFIIYFASAAVTVGSSHMTVSSSASWSRFSPPSNFVNGRVSTLWFMVCRWPQSQKGDWASAHLCKLARHGAWPVRKRFIKDHVWRGSHGSDDWQRQSHVNEVHLLVELRLQPRLPQHTANHAWMRSICWSNSASSPIYHTTPNQSHHSLYQWTAISTTILPVTPSNNSSTASVTQRQ